MKKYVAIFLIMLMMGSLIGCNSTDLTQDPVEQEQENEETSTNDSSEGGVARELEYANNLEINISMGNNQRTITYNQATPLILPDGTSVAQGDLKPTWQYYEKLLGFSIEDMAIQDQKATEMMDLAAAISFSDATIYGGNSIAEDFVSYGPQGYFLDLTTRMDDMPAVKVFFEDNQDVLDSITAYDGGVYYLPYVAEIGNYARVFAGRESWVTALLDSNITLEAETATINTEYEGFEDRHESNVIKLQNEASNGTLTRDVALETLLTYISETYPDLEKPSDLYLNATAQYDIDELIALWRVVELSPNTLSKLETGSIVADAEISPFFVRKAEYREDVLRLATYFGGQRVHGSDSYAARFYLNEDNELTYSYSEDSFLEIVGYLQDIYKEGLIHSEFAEISSKDDFRKALYSSDENEGQRQFGFMTYDWIASTTAANADVVGMLPPLTQIGTDEYIHYMENTRVIKPDGWGISTAASEEEINSALKMFNLLFTEEGHQAQNYGIPQNLVDGETFMGPDGVEYPKFNDWLLDTAAELKNSDVSGFLRDFMGSQIPIGYQKEIGFEYQYTVNRGWDAWALYNDAEVRMTSYDANEPLFKLVPTVFSLTEQDTAKLATVSINEEQTDQIFLFITDSSNALESPEDLKAMFESSGVDVYIDVYKNAYERMLQ